MNKPIHLAAIGFCIAAVTLGCNKVGGPQPEAATSSAGVAVIDLDEVARQLGSDKQIVSAIKQRQAALNGKLSELAQSYTAELQKQKEAIEAENDHAAVQLATYQQQASQSLVNAKAKAQQNLSQHRSQLVNQFRTAVLPAARKAAHKRGLTVILTKQDSLLYDYTSEHDITAEVVDLLRASSKQQAAPQKPAENQG